jgi:hypothetical protein
MSSSRDHNTADHQAATELELYATNIKAYIGPVVQTLTKKWKAGVFDYQRAIDYVDRYCLIPAAKSYKREFMSMADKWSDTFSKPVRQEAARSIVDHWVAEFKIGNFWD